MSKRSSSRPWLVTIGVPEEDIPSVDEAVVNILRTLGIEKRHVIPSAGVLKGIAYKLKAVLSYAEIQGLCGGGVGEALNLYREAASKLGLDNSSTEAAELVYGLLVMIIETVVALPHLNPNVEGPDPCQRLLEVMQATRKYYLSWGRNKREAVKRNWRWRERRGERAKVGSRISRKAILIR